MAYVKLWIIESNHSAKRMWMSARVSKHLSAHAIAWKFCIVTKSYMCAVCVCVIFFRCFKHSFCRGRFVISSKNMRLCWAIHSVAQCAYDHTTHLRRWLKIIEFSKNKHILSHSIESKHSQLLQLAIHKSAVCVHIYSTSVYFIKRLRPFCTGFFVSYHENNDTHIR